MVVRVCRVCRVSRPAGIGAIVLAGLVAALPARPAHAEGAPAPSPAQLERARQAFADGKQLHDAGKLAEAIEKFKLSYELSRNPLLLYNIALTMQELGSDDLAVVYYRRFLAEAPADTAQRQDAAGRIAALTRTLAPPAAGATGNTIAEPGEPPPPGAAQDPAEPPETGATRDVGFTHRPIEYAPPGKPLDVTAQLARGDGLTMTLFFRTAGHEAFTSTPMLPRAGERVGRIPASRLTGGALQYYVEARDAGGALVARSGRSTVPNVVAIDAAAPPRFYPDVAEPVLTEAARGDRDVEDPLARGGAAAAAGDGLFDVGSPRFAIAKWSTSAVAGVGLSLGVTFYLLARDHARALEDDATGCGAPPCQTFDVFDRDIERTGKVEQTISNVALFGGLAVAAVAGYFWFRELTAPSGEPSPRAAARPRRRPAAQAATWRIVPSLGSLAPAATGGTAAGFTGATAAVRF